MLYIIPFVVFFVLLFAWTVVLRKSRFNESKLHEWIAYAEALEAELKDQDTKHRRDMRRLERECRTALKVSQRLTHSAVSVETVLDCARQAVNENEEYVTSLRKANNELASANRELEALVGQMTAALARQGIPAAKRNGHAQVSQAPTPIEEPEWVAAMMEEEN